MENIEKDIDKSRVTDKEEDLYCYFGNVKAEIEKQDDGYYGFTFILDENTTKEDIESIRTIDKEIRSILEEKGSMNFFDLIDELYE